MSVDMQTRIYTQIRQSIAVKQSVLNDLKIIEQIQFLAKACLATLRAGGKIIFAGNGGSFADAQHLSAEFTSRLMLDRAPLASIALGTNNSALSAIGNDYGYDQVFARELAGIGKVEDVFIPISTSGNSPNILAAVRVANELGILTVGMTGQPGGGLMSNCNCLSIPSDQTARIQECHIMIGHILCSLVEEEFFRKKVS
ncbi:SIS domain-containing protein [Polynucleobacter paneuropaeus]|jgi:D-sedoheptulose 7-phosphate isomerase|nr:SIS domain-containing protein [Polynucleobacter paneuropaeus]